MTDAREAIIARLAKMQALAEGGVGGERENAARLMKEVARKNGIDLDHIGKDEVKDYLLHIPKGWKLDLFVQLATLLRVEMYKDIKAPYCQIIETTFRMGRTRRKVYSFRGTNAQFCELHAKFAVLSRDYANQLRAVFRAFLQANDLLLPCAPDRQPTDAERKRAEIASRLALGIKRSQLHKQLKGGEE